MIWLKRCLIVMGMTLINIIVGMYAVMWWNQISFIMVCLISTCVFLYLWYRYADSPKKIMLLVLIISVLSSGYAYH